MIAAFYRILDVKLSYVWSLYFAGCPSATCMRLKTGMRGGDSFVNTLGL